jgi:aquaporin Z
VSPAAGGGIVETNRSGATTGEGSTGYVFCGLANGFTLVEGAFAVGPVTGGAFNPAVGLGATIMALADLIHLVLHLIVDFAGGAECAR